MTNYWEPTAVLLHRSDDTLSDDERSSVEYFLAFIDELDGFPPSTPERRWCRLASKVASSAHQLGRLPTLHDGLSRAQIEWIAAQKAATLNSFQRARLGAIQGWFW